MSKSHGQGRGLARARLPDASLRQEEDRDMEEGGQRHARAQSRGQGRGRDLLLRSDAVGDRQIHTPGTHTVTEKGIGTPTEAGALAVVRLHQEETFTVTGLRPAPFQDLDPHHHVVQAQDHLLVDVPQITDGVLQDVEGGAQGAILSVQADPVRGQGRDLIRLLLGEVCARVAVEARVEEAADEARDPALGQGRCRIRVVRGAGPALGVTGGGLVVLEDREAVAMIFETVARDHLVRKTVRVRLPLFPSCKKWYFNQKLTRF